VAVAKGEWFIYAVIQRERLSVRYCNVRFIKHVPRTRENYYKHRLRGPEVGLLPQVHWEQVLILRELYTLYTLTGHID
jgi:hypothetical protein